MQLTQDWLMPNTDDTYTVFPKDKFKLLIKATSIDVPSKRLDFELIIQHVSQPWKLAAGKVQVREAGVQDGYTNQAAYDTYIAALDAARLALEADPENTTLQDAATDLENNPVTLVPNIINIFDEFWTDYIDLAKFSYNDAGAIYMASTIGAKID